MDMAELQLGAMVAAQQEKILIDSLIMQAFAPPQYFVNPMRTQSAAAHSAAPSTSPQQAPITTVFVGNITEKCTNEFIQTMLDKCGRVSNWKRIQGSNGKFQAFGFCEFEHPEGTLRALRVLNEFGIADKKLVVKAEDKVRDLLCAFDAEARKRAGKEPLKLAPGKLPGDEEALKKDEEVRLDILNIIEKDFPELLTVEDGELSDKEKDKKDDKDRRRRSSVDRSRKDDDRRRRRSRSRSRSAKRSGRNSRRSRSPKHKRKRRGSSTSSSDSDSRSSSSDSSSGSERAARRKKVKKSRSGSRGGDSEDSDDARERKALKRSMKEKEEHYMARLKKWEDRERSKSKQYDKEESRENQKKREIQKEAKKLKHFLEDYDDERDDGKYYKSSSLFQRKRDFEKEKEADAKDRQREAAEIEELKKQILAEGVTFTKGESVEELAKKRHEQQEEAAARKRRADSGSPNPHHPLGQNGESSSSSEDDDDDDKEKVLEEAKKELAWNSVGTASPASASPLVIKLEATSVNTGVASPAIKAEVASPKEQKIGIDQRLSGVFGMDDEEDELTRRKKLKPFEITKEERMQAMTHEERVKLTKQLIDSIPKGKEELFAYTLDWSFIDDKLVESRVRPWVAKKIREYIGEEEVSLVQFVCEKVSSKTPPLKILSDISMILDDEAEVFVVKMWRLLIYESEAMKQGLHPPKA